MRDLEKPELDLVMMAIDSFLEGDMPSKDRQCLEKVLELYEEDLALKSTRKGPRKAGD